MVRDDGHGERHWVRLLLRGPLASVVLASVYSLWSTLHTETMAAFGRLGQALVVRQPTYAFERISCPMCSRGSHLESGALFPLSLYLAVIVPGVWVLLKVRKLDSSGDDFLRGCNAWYNSGYMFCVGTLVTLEECTHFLRGGRLVS